MARYLDAYPNESLDFGSAANSDFPALQSPEMGCGFPYVLYAGATPSDVAMWLNAGNGEPWPMRPKRPSGFRQLAVSGITTVPQRRNDCECGGYRGGSSENRFLLAKLVSEGGHEKRHDEVDDGL